MNATTESKGSVLAANRLVSNTTDDQAGYDRVTALSNGNYVVQIPDWDNSSATDAGTVT